MLRYVGSVFGSIFRIATWGESHGGGVGVVVDGCPPLLKLQVEEIQHDLNRRRPGQSDLTTPRDEADRVEILSGVFDGITLGTPISLFVKNTDAKPEAYEHLKEVYRPSHADFTTQEKYGIRNWQGGGRSSARETIGRVAAGAIARKLLKETENIEVLAWVSSVHSITSEIKKSKVTAEMIEEHPTRCPDPNAAHKIQKAIEIARENGDSLGGIITCIARGVPAGLGEPVFDRLEADLAKGMLSLPASKGFDIGSGFNATTMTGKEHNDPFLPGKEGPTLGSNNSGGVQGGISNAADIYFRVAFKPTATISSAQETVDDQNQAITLEAQGRHDPCVLPRAVPMVEAMTLLVLADHWLRQKTVQVFSN